MACASLYSGGGGLKTLDDLLPVETRVHLRPYDSNYQNDMSRELGLPKNHSTRPATRNTTARGELDWIFDTSSLADTFLSIPSHWKDKEWSQLVEFLIYNRFCEGYLRRINQDFFGGECVEVEIRIKIWEFLKIFGDERIRIRLKWYKRYKFYLYKCVTYW